jgi:plasmid stabilization system protein ParE
MARVTWALDALADLESTADYIGLDSEDAAHRLTVRAFELTDQLDTYPLIGRAVPEFGRTDLRELILGNYRILYLVRGNSGSVVAFVHGAMDLTRHPRARSWT